MHCVYTAPYEGWGYGQQKDFLKLHGVVDHAYLNKQHTLASRKDITTAGPAVRAA